VGRSSDSCKYSTTLPCSGAVGFQTCYPELKALVSTKHIANLSWGMCDALVESKPFIRKVMGATPALAAT